MGNFDEETTEGQKEGENRPKYDLKSVYAHKCCFNCPVNKLKMEH